MRSISSPVRLPKWVQWCLLGVCAILSVVYWDEPAHHLQTELWTQRLTSIGYIFGLGSAQDDILLRPRLEVAQGAQPLIDFGAIQFLGCDLALKGEQPQLVTYWSDAVAQDSLQMILRYVAPVSALETHATQSINASMLMTPLPQDFYADGQRGEVWLRAIDQHTKQPVDIVDSLWQPDSEGWVHICS